jgi:hypothetical protein
MSFTLKVVLMVAAFNALLFAIAPEPVFALRHILASLLLWLSVYPAWRYLARAERNIPFMPIFGAAYFFFYGLPAFHRTLTIRGARLDSTVDTALALALAGEALLLIAYYQSLVRFRALPQIRLALDVPRRATRILVIAYLAIIARVVIARLQSGAGAAQLLAVLHLLPTLLLALLLVARLRAQLPSLHAALALVAALAVLLLDFASGAVAQPVLTLTVYFFVYVCERGRIPIGVILISAFLVIPMLGTKGEYRKAIQKSSSLDTFDRIELFSEMIARVISGGRDTYRHAGDVAESRVDHLSDFSYVIAKTPEAVPYWGGETYAGFFWSFIPRFIYPYKPNKTLGQEYGHRYGFLDSRDYWTSINLEQTVELYANFGVAGVLAGMFLLGLLYRALMALFGHPGAGDGGTVIAAAVFRTLLNIESDFSLVFGGIIQTAIVLYVVLYLIARPERALAPTAA